ncbi:hypothetical protein [Thalassotalea sp. PP2-459]|uniref:hypothetical protein n=1 Tax=Thalassotalea sp. PP2-459 TaxID=1742724 RepID=UPI000944C5D6|nr:hypothetical protein [Thalassotalea sp. PP2-459]OKY24652.1 hypothetical protein BI291_05515 [Thalassotalea sp. PP2-459]
MFKKTLLAATLAATAASATAGSISVSGTAYKVGNEYLGAYTGSALSGDLEAGTIGIQYRAGIALGVNNTLKFDFAGGAIASDTGLKLQVIDNTVADPLDAAVQTDIDNAVAAVANATGNTQAELDVELAAAKAAAIEVINATTTATNATAAIAAINALTIAPGVAGDAKAAVAAANEIVIGDVGAAVADLVDFGEDANGDYEWVLFKLTTATAADAVLVFNDTDGDHAANVVTKFTKATIGAGDLTVGLPEAKDDTGTVLAAPVAEAKTLVTTENQFALTATAVTDTIDVEQDRLFFSDAIGDDVTTDFVFDITVDGTIDLGIDHTTAEFAMELTGNFTGVEQADYTETDIVGTNDTAVFDADNMVEGVGISDATVAITVDGDTNLATRTVKASMMITPTEADTNAFYLLGSSSAGANAFIWDLNGSEITFPYAPIGYDHVTTNFELANSGDQTGDVLITAFTREGVAYSGTLVGKAEAESLTKISEAEVYDALMLTEGTSLSVTFSTTAPDADIKISGYSNLASGGRMALLSDAYEGEKASCTGTIAGGNGTITCN